MLLPLIGGLGIECTGEIALDDVVPVGAFTVHSIYSSILE
jgi:hypothetical protein